MVTHCVSLSETNKSDARLTRSASSSSGAARAQQTAPTPGGGEAQLVQSSLVNDFALAKTALRAPRPEISIERRFEGSFIAIARRISISALLRRREDESSD